jgi:hypothetical protein
LQTIHEILAPNGFLPVPLQKGHFFKGSSTSTIPLPLQTRQSDIGDSKSNGSLPFPPQNAHFITFDMVRFELMVLMIGVEMILLPIFGE